MSRRLTVAVGGAPAGAKSKREEEGARALVGRGGGEDFTLLALGGELSWW